MDWAADQWKQDLPASARQKITALEEQVARTSKAITQKQLQMDQIEQALNKQKLKVEEEKLENKRLLGQLQSLSENNFDLQSKFEKSQLDLNQKSGKLEQLECLRSKGDDKPNLVLPNATNSKEQHERTIEKLRQEIDELKVNNSRLEAQSRQQQLSAENPFTFPEKIGTPAKARFGNNSENQLDKLRLENNLSQDKISQLEGKLRQLAQELECQRHNAEATKAAMENKFKANETSLRDEIRQHLNSVIQKDKEMLDLQNKLQQASGQIHSFNSLKLQVEQSKAALSLKEKECGDLQGSLERLLRTKDDLEQQVKDIRDKFSKMQENKEALQIN